MTRNVENEGSGHLHTSLRKLGNVPVAARNCAGRAKVVSAWIRVAPQHAHCHMGWRLGPRLLVAIVCLPLHCLAHIAILNADHSDILCHCVRCV